MKRKSLFVIVVLLLALTACQPAGDAAPPEEEQQAPGPTPVPVVFFIPNVDANCRLGPSVMYPVLAVLTPGAEYQVLGINEDGTWLFINTSLTQCWVKLTTGQASEDVSQFPLIAYGPVPTPDPSMAGGQRSGDSGGSDVSAEPGIIFTIYPGVLTLCGSYTTVLDCVNAGCDWVMAIYPGQQSYCTSK